MEWEAWAILAILAAAGVGLFRHAAGPDVILLGGLALAVGLGIVDAERAVSGFANPGLVTIAALFVVVAGLEATGAMRRFVQPLLGRPGSLRRAQARLLPAVAGLSAFVNNTPVVAMFLPVVSDWARRLGMSPSRLLLPLSYAAILGGTCTLIGTSTNLVIHGMLAREGPAAELSLLAPAWVGLPCALIGGLYMLLLGPRLLPDRSPVFSAADEARSYAAELVVEPAGPLVDRTIEEAGLRRLPGLYLAEIVRGDEVLAAVGPQQRLRAGDRLVFVGRVDSVVELRRTPGLAPAPDQVFRLDAPAPKRRLVEAVVSDSCPLVGVSIRAGRFRTRYQAAVIAVARHGRPLRERIGDIVLQPGDTLLLEAPEGFVERERHRRDFFLVTTASEEPPPRHARAVPALAILGAMVVLAATGALSMLAAALLAAAAMVATRCCTTAEARRGMDVTVLLTIGGALGLGEALAASGAARGLADALLALVGDEPWWGLAVIYGLTMVFTAFVTNNAAAVLMFPIAVAAADALGAAVTPFAVAVMLAASNDFATPVGYQTNLMVFSPGGYRARDYLRFGLPLNALVAAVSLIVIPWVWPL